MKILIVMGGFFPGKKYGGPPVSVDNFCSLMTEVDCYIVTTNHDMGEVKDYTGITKGWNERKNCKVLYLKDNQYKSNYFEKAIHDVKPELLYLQGLFQSCVFSCLRLAKKNRLKVLLAPRGELCAGAFKKKYKKVPYIGLLRILGFLDGVHFQATSEEETNAIRKYLNVSKDRIHYLPNIPSLSKQKHERTEKQRGTGDFVFLSRIMPKKNLIFALECFQRIKGDVNFDIYGPIEDTQYWKECEGIIKQMPSNIKIEYKGLVDHENVHKVFSQYHAFVFPTLSENYGHVIAEALAAGTPVIISDQTPWRHLKEYGVGCDADLGDMDAFITTIQEIIDMDNQDFIKISESAKQYFFSAIKLDEIKAEYRKCFQSI